MDLTLIAETQSTVTLGWTPSPEQAWVLAYVDDERVTNASGRYEKGARVGELRDRIEFEKAETYRVEVLGVDDTGVYPAVPSDAFDLPTYSVAVPSGKINQWLFHNSPTTQVIGTDGNGFRQRCIVWDKAGGESKALYEGKTMFALTGFRLVTNYPNRMCNWHIQPNDDPHGWYPLTGPGGKPVSGVSPLAIDCNTARGLQVVLEAESSGDAGKFTIFTPSQIAARHGQWIWIWMEVGFGRSDTLPDGYLKVWVAGEDDSPRINVTLKNTHWYEQHQATYLQGAYWSQGSPGCATEHAATRFGRTPEECYYDVPVFHGQTSASSITGSSTRIAPRKSTEAAIPAQLQW